MTVILIVYTFTFYLLAGHEGNPYRDIITKYIVLYFGNDRELYFYEREGARDEIGERGYIFNMLQAIQPTLACYVQEK